MNEKMKFTIPAEILDSNYTIGFRFGSEGVNGQVWSGMMKGRERVGDNIRVRRQVGLREYDYSYAYSYDYSYVEVINRECPVTGDVILTLRAMGRSASD